MDLQKLAKLIDKSGVKPADIEAFGHIPFSAGELSLFAEMIVKECAQIQATNSCARHGYDKHNDEAAILRHFGIDCAPA